MLIHSLWHFAGFWQEEVQFDWYGQIMDQTFLVPIRNYRKHWKRWMIWKSRIVFNEMYWLNFVAQEHTRSIICERCVGTPNSNSKRYLRRIAKNTWSFIKWWGTENLNGRSKSIINSRPLTVKTLSGINSQIPFSPSKLLTVKTNVVMPPNGLLTNSRRRWRHVQHIAEEFWRR